MDKNKNKEVGDSTENDNIQSTETQQPATVNYVNNKLLYLRVSIWRNLCVMNNKEYVIPKKIAKDIMAISKNMTRRFNFSGYTQDWKEEMYWDGIEVCVKGLLNFNPNKYKNVFGYISKACFRAFLQRIAKERREAATRYRFYAHHVYAEFTEEMTRTVDEEFLQDVINKLNGYEETIANRNLRNRNRNKSTEDQPINDLTAFMS